MPWWDRELAPCHDWFARCARGARNSNKPVGTYRVRMEIWINPACSKCRSALTLLDAEGADYTVRRYLEDVPSEDEIRGVLERLGLEPWDITRTQEADAKELGLKEWPRDAASRDRWITALAEHPKLIQRPIITADDGTAVVGRTDEAVRDALSR
ncbi:arsenate reductase family protein [Streptomyces hawaiiensis]